MWGYFLALFAVFVLLYGLVFFTGDRQPVPRLGLDLVGGTTVTLSARTTDGKAPDEAKLELARQIIENRVDGLGVAEPEVVTEGNENIVISVAGQNSEEIKQIGEPAQLRFRKVLNSVPDVPDQPAKPTPKPSATPSGGPSSSPSPSGGPTAQPSPSATQTPAAGPGTAEVTPAGNGDVRPAQVSTAGTGGNGPSYQNVADASPTPSTSATPKPTTAPAPPPKASGSRQLPTVAQVEKKLFAAGLPKQFSIAALRPQIQQLLADPQQVQQVMGQLAQTPELAAFKKLTPEEIAVLPSEVQLGIPQITCKKLNERPPGVTDDPKQNVVACDGQMKYLMDVAKVQGTDVNAANYDYSPGGQGSQAGWRVTLNFKTGGQDKWTNLTKESVNKQVAIVLDNEVVSAPNINQVISGQAEITGGFTQQTAEQLANKLKYGALPVSFEQQNAQSISATLGLAQLQAGLIAGAIGVGLVLLYVLLYYRMMGFVTFLSLILSAAIIYPILVLLGRPELLGFTLTLSGIAGFIMAIGTTADSFVIFFERLKDELREGRTPRSAVPRAWTRARGTILSGDAVSFLAAACLYILAAGEVRGFAFTLGMSTVLDLIVVFLFTHPIVVVMSRYKTFMSPRISGLGQVHVRKSVERPGPGRTKPLTKGA